VNSYSYSKFSPEEIEILSLAMEVVALLPDRGEDGELVRCHEVARVVALVARDLGHELWVQDGSYGFCDHSWLWTTEPESDAWLRRPDRYNCPNILDPYCVGSLPQVRLVDCSSTALPHHGMMYRLGSPREDVREGWVREESSRVSKILSGRPLTGR